MSSKTIKSLNVSGTCMETYPCKHGMIITYTDNSKESTGINGHSAVTNKYWNHLCKDDKDHFSYMKKLVLERDDKTNYQDFLSEVGSN